MKNDHIYKKIREAMEALPDNFSVLEEQIDVELQMEYYKYGKQISREESSVEVLSRKDDLFRQDVPLDDKKNLLVLLAAVNEVEAFRAIESYVKKPDEGLHDWAVLALQESRMVIHSMLLDEQQVFISTGLGGLGQKLRYFMVLMGENFQIDFTSVQKKLLEGEIRFKIQKEDGEVEEVFFEEGLAIILCLLPLKADIQKLTESIVDECNQLGKFLSEDVLVTNVRKLTVDEIKQFLLQGSEFPGLPEFDGGEDEDED